MSASAFFGNILRSSMNVEPYITNTDHLVANKEQGNNDQIFLSAPQVPCPSLNRPVTRVNYDRQTYSNENNAQTRLPLQNLHNSSARNLEKAYPNLNHQSDNDNNQIENSCVTKDAELSFLLDLIYDSGFYTEKTNSHVYQTLISSCRGCRLLLGYVRDEEDRYKKLMMEVSENDENGTNKENEEENEDDESLEFLDDENCDEFEETIPKKERYIFNSYKLCDILIEHEFIKLGYRYE